MAGLETLTGDDPSGSESPTQGDNRIRELTQKVKESVSKEHSLTGYHAIPSGKVSGSVSPETNRPAAGNRGRLYILAESGVAKELQYDNGSSWETITKNQIIIDEIANTSTHRSAATIDHPNKSIKKEHLDDGILAKKHFGSAFANDGTSVVNLINGSELDSSWHTHPKTEVISSGLPTFLSSAIELVSGSTTLGGNTGWITYKGLSSSEVPDGAVAVILEGVCHIDLAQINMDVTYSPKIEVRGRRSNGSNSAVLELAGGYIGYKGTVGDSNTYSMGWRGQGICPITTTVVGEKRNIDYKVYNCNKRELSSYDNGFVIRLVGYI